MPLDLVYYAEVILLMHSVDHQLRFVISGETVGEDSTTVLARVAVEVGK